MSMTKTEGAPPELVVDGRVAIVRLRRPDQANRLETGDILALTRVFDDLATRLADVRALVLTGTGRHFSAGFNLGAVDEVISGEATALFARMADALEALPQTTLCALNGGVFGGATDLALACDFRVGVPTTRLFMPAARFGLHYYETGLRRYLTRLGLNAAKRLFLLAEELDAQALLQIGYLTHIAPADALMDEALAIAHRAASLAPLATSGMKAALDAMAAGRYDPQEGARVFAACQASDDLREGLAAHAAQRNPQFKAR